MYSKHRNSSSFREYQEQQRLKRLHPLDYINQSNDDLIDVNNLVKKIRSNKTGDSIKYFTNELEGEERW